MLHKYIEHNTGVVNVYMGKILIWYTYTSNKIVMFFTYIENYIDVVYIFIEHNADVV